MKKINVRYVAQVEINKEIIHKNDPMPFDEFRHMICGGDLTNAIREHLSDCLMDCVTVTQQYADVYEVDEDE